MVECLECNNQCWVSFQLVDEAGDGKAYAGLNYELTDTEGNIYQGTLNANGASIKHENISCGGMILSFKQLYNGADEWYITLINRNRTSSSPMAEYSLPTSKQNGYKSGLKPFALIPEGAIKHHQLEVRDFVESVMHLLL